MDVIVIISQGFIQFKAQHSEPVGIFKSEDLDDQNVEFLRMFIDYQDVFIQLHWCQLISYKLYRTVSKDQNEFKQSKIKSNIK